MSEENIIRTKMYLHGSKEDNHCTGKKLGLSEEALKKFRYALYEVTFDVEIDKETGDVKIITVDGRKLAE